MNLEQEKTSLKPAIFALLTIESVVWSVADKREQ